MQIVKNIFISLLYMMIVSILIVIFYRIGIHKYINITTSAIIFGLLISLYFKSMISSFFCYMSYYGLLFFLSQTIDVLIMFFISLSTMIIVKLLSNRRAEIGTLIKEKQLYKE